MKRLVSHLLVGLLAVTGHAEKVEVYQCETKFASVDWAKSGKRDNVSKFQVGRMTKKVGVIETECLFDLANEAWAYERSKKALDEEYPFFGNGDEYILKDSKGRFYLVFFEYEKVARRYDSPRIGISVVPPLDGMNPVFAGSPYDGTSFDKSLIRQLKEIAKNLVDQSETDKFENNTECYLFDYAKSASPSDMKIESGFLTQSNRIERLPVPKARALVAKLLERGGGEEFVVQIELSEQPSDDWLPMLKIGDVVLIDEVSVERSDRENSKALLTIKTGNARLLSGWMDDLAKLFGINPENVKIGPNIKGLADPGAGQPATHSESDSEAGDKPQPESERRSR